LAGPFARLAGRPRRQARHRCTIGHVTPPEDLHCRERGIVCHQRGPPAAAGDRGPERRRPGVGLGRFAPLVGGAADEVAERGPRVGRGRDHAIEDDAPGGQPVEPGHRHPRRAVGGQDPGRQPVHRDHEQAGG
jgi:hypothetical protein